MPRLETHNTLGTDIRGEDEDYPFRKGRVQIERSADGKSEWGQFEVFSGNGGDVATVKLDNVEQLEGLISALTAMSNAWFSLRGPAHGTSM